MKTELLQELRELNPDALLADGFEEAFTGIGQQFNRYLAAYDYGKCIAILAQDMSDLEPEERKDVAEEYFEFNVVGAWMGENTPIFLHTEEQGERS